MVAGTESSFEDHCLDVVIQDLFGVSAEVFEGIEVALDEGVRISGERKDCIPHSGIAEDHVEAVQSLLPSVDIQMVALTPINLRLDAGFGLEPENRLQGYLRPDCADVILDNGIASIKSHFLNFTEDPGGGQGVVSNTVLDVAFIGIEFARSWPAGNGCRHGLAGKILSHRVSMISGLPGDLADIQPLVM